MHAITSLPRRSRSRSRRPLAVALLLALGSAGSSARAQEAYPDEATLQRILDRQALRIPGEDVLHFYWWRREVPVTWQGRPVEVFEGQSLRLSVQRSGDECVASGWWLLFADETLPVVSALTAGGLRVTSVVPRFPGATPQPFELRFLGRGTETELAGPIADARQLLDRIRAAGPPPPALPTSEATGESDVSVRPLEELFGCKSEVKDGVALFRLPGPRGLDGKPAGSRMGLALYAAFAGRDEAARVRVDWVLSPAQIPTVLGDLGAKGLVLESLAAAAPGFDDDLSQVCLVGHGTALDLARALRAELDEVDVEPLALEASFEAPRSPERLGLASGALAAGWRSAATHPAGPQRAAWTVETDAANGPVACMTAPGDWDSTTFNLLLNDGVSFQDGALTLRMRADRGRIDQGGGPVWRVQDADNYYVCRFNPLEQDFRVYRVKDGVRTQIQAIGGLPFRSGDWFTIRVEQQGDQIACTLNGGVVLRVRDDTFPAAGGVGIWSKADSQPSLAGFYVDPSEPAR